MTALEEAQDRLGRIALVLDRPRDVAEPEQLVVEERAAALDVLVEMQRLTDRAGP